MSEPNSLAGAIPGNAPPRAAGTGEAFGCLKLLRPLRLYKGALGLEVGRSAAPDPDFLFILFCGQRHMAFVRAGMAPSAFKNLEHLVRAEHNASATTNKQLQVALGVDGDALGRMVHGNAHGHLLPDLVAVVEMLEALYRQTFEQLASAVLVCQCCQNNVLDDTHVWWSGQDQILAPDAYEFVERLLQVVAGADLFMELFDRPSRPHPGQLSSLLAPSVHPIGQWMEMARAAKRLEAMCKLSQTPGVATGDEGSVADNRLRKWKSGQDLLPLGTARAMIAGTPEQARLDKALLAARVFALAIDVVRSCATGDGYPTRERAQQVIAARFAQLLENVRISRAVQAKRRTGGEVQSRLFDAAHRPN